MKVFIQCTSLNSFKEFGFHCIYFIQWIINTNSHDEHIMNTHFSTTIYIEIYYSLLFLFYFFCCSLLLFFFYNQSFKITKVPLFPEQAGCSAKILKAITVAQNITKNYSCTEHNQKNSCRTLSRTTDAEHYQEQQMQNIIKNNTDAGASPPYIVFLMSKAKVGPNSRTFVSLLPVYLCNIYNNNSTCVIFTKVISNYSSRWNCFSLCMEEIKAWVILV